MAELEDLSRPFCPDFLESLAMRPTETGRWVDVRHSLPHRPPAPPIVIGIVLVVVAGVGAAQAVWLESSSSSNATPSGRGEECADRSRPRG